MTASCLSQVMIKKIRVNFGNQKVVLGFFFPSFMVLNKHVVLLILDQAELDREEKGEQSEGTEAA